MRNKGGGEEGRSLGHKLNITDNFLHKIILLVTMSVMLSIKISRHYIICLLESHYNTAR